jgi:cobalamin biosynthesis protein CobD/CbiB
MGFLSSFFLIPLAMNLAYPSMIAVMGRPWWTLLPVCIIGSWLQSRWKKKNIVEESMHDATTHRLANGFVVHFAMNILAMTLVYFFVLSKFGPRI